MGEARAPADEALALRSVEALAASSWNESNSSCPVRPRAVHSRRDGSGRAAGAGLRQNGGSSSPSSTPAVTDPVAEVLLHLTFAAARVAVLAPTTVSPRGGSARSHSEPGGNRLDRHTGLAEGRWDDKELAVEGRELFGRSSNPLRAEHDALLGLALEPQEDHCRRRSGTHEEGCDQGKPERGRRSRVAGGSAPSSAAGASSGAGCSRVRSSVWLPSREAARAAASSPQVWKRSSGRLRERTDDNRVDPGRYWVSLAHVCGFPGTVPLRGRRPPSLVRTAATP